MGVESLLLNGLPQAKAAALNPKLRRAVDSLARKLNHPKACDLGFAAVRGLRFRFE